MERLIADASKMTKEMEELGVSVEADNMSFNNIINAISVVQKHLDITGTTAEEAGTTITGSVNSAKAAWQNFMSGMGTAEEVIETFTTAGTNISNAVIKIAPRIAEGLIQVVNGIAPQIPTLLEGLLPPIINGATQLIKGLVNSLPTLIPILMNGLMMAIEGLIPLIPQIIDALIQATIMIMNALAENLPVILPQIVDGILQIIPMLFEYLPLFLEAGGKLIGGLIAGIVASLPDLLSKGASLAVGLLKELLILPLRCVDLGINIVKGVWNGIKNVKTWLIDKIKGFGKNILSSMKSVLGIHSPSKEFAWIGKMNVLGLEEGMEDMKGDLQNTFDGMFDLSPNLYGNASTNLSPKVNVVVNNSYETDPLGQVVNKIKTFSGGAKNDYNYGK